MRMSARRVCDGEVARAAVADVTVASTPGRLHHERRHRLADDVAAADDHALRARRLHAVRLRACRSTPAGVHGAKPSVSPISSLPTFTG